MVKPAAHDSFYKCSSHFNLISKFKSECWIGRESYPLLVDILKVLT